jgi:hypothetical protein
LGLERGKPTAGGLTGAMGFFRTGFGLDFPYVWRLEILSGSKNMGKSEKSEPPLTVAEILALPDTTVLPRV